jgi:hypothetical protein
MVYPSPGSRGRLSLRTQAMSFVSMAGRSRLVPSSLCSPMARDVVRSSVFCKARQRGGLKGLCSLSFCSPLSIQRHWQN